MFSINGDLACCIFKDIRISHIRNLLGKTFIINGGLELEKLFSYGTLQMGNVQQETFGRLLSGKKDILIGYVLSEVKIKDESVIAKSGTDIHPILRLTGNSEDEVDGTIYEVTKEELQQADEYEVEEYARIKTSFKSGSKAWVYAAADQINNV